MTDEKRRRKFGLSLKTAKKLVVENKEESNNALRLQAKNIRHAKPKNTGRSRSTVIDIDDFSDVHESSISLQPKSSCEIKTKADIAQNDNEKSLWRDLFSSDTTVYWENLEDLPKSDIATSVEQDDTRLTATSNTNTDGSTKHINHTSKDLSNNELDYVDLPKPCMSCYTRKPVKLIYSTDEVSTTQSTETELELPLMNEPRDSTFSQSTLLDSMAINYTSKTSSHTDGQRNDGEISSVTKNVQKKRKFDYQEQSDFQMQSKKNFIVERKNVNSEIIDCGQIKWSYGKNDSQGKSSDLPKSNFSATHGPKNENKMSNHEKRKDIYKKYDHPEKSSQQQRNNFSTGPHSGYFKRKEIETKRSFSSSNIVIDLTDDDVKQNSHTLDNKIYSKSNMTSFSANINKYPPKSTNQKLNSHAPVESNKPSNERLNESRDINRNKEVLKCCPMCQLQFSNRTNKQEIDNHISSCIGNEVIIDDDSDEDW